MKKITLQDLESWKSETLKTAHNLGYSKILPQLVKVNLEVIPRDSEKMFYGWAYLLEPGTIAVYQTNPSKYLPPQLRKIWNQSGMDHELIGHIGNYLLGNKYGEDEAIATQREFIKERAKTSNLWRIASWIEPKLTQFRLNNNREFY